MIRRTLLTIVVSLFLASTVSAEQSEIFGNYTIHYSAFTTDYLTPEVAKLYQIPRSKNRALVNISIVKNDDGILGKPVKALVEGAAKNLSEQLRELNIREISSEGAVYYIAETRINDQETLKYNFQITPEGESSPYQITFQEQFYTN